MTELEFQQIQENQAKAAEIGDDLNGGRHLPPVFIYSTKAKPYNKYGVSPVDERTVGGIVFASKAEAWAYSKLKHLQETGEVTRLELQPVFKFPPGFEYRADFRVTYSDGRTVVIDVKGVHTDVFKLKRKCMEFFYPEVVLVLWGKPK